MGGRGNIAVIQSEDYKEQVWFYGHWAGWRMPAVLQMAIREGKGRWQDPSYFARVVFCRLVPSDDRYLETTSYGIGATIGDNEHPIMVADCPRQRVFIISIDSLREGRVPRGFEAKREWTFDEYCALEKLPWGDMAGQLKEVGRKQVEVSHA
jgi:hypothetical protein